MVFYFHCVDDRFVVFMGRDKYENEELLKYAFPEDVWFHVNDLSSAHVYLRRPFGMSLEEIPEKVIAEMCQLVKNNSIEGSKADHVDIIYCEFPNLVKHKKMEAGAVSYLNEHNNHYIRNVKKDSVILKRIEKSRDERDVDLAQLKKDRDMEEKHRQKKFMKDKEHAEREEAKKKKAEDDILHYIDFQNKKELMTSNKNTNNAEDDFM